MLIKVPIDRNLPKYYIITAGRRLNIVTTAGMRKVKSAFNNSNKTSPKYGKY